MFAHLLRCEMPRFPKSPGHFFGQVNTIMDISLPIHVTDYNHFLRKMKKVFRKANGNWPNAAERKKRLKQKLFFEDPTCKLCGKLFHRVEDATLDHILPKSKGGPKHFAPYNTQLACLKCNAEKGNKIDATIHLQILQQRIQIKG